MLNVSRKYQLLYRMRCLNDGKVVGKLEQSDFSAFNDEEAIAKANQSLLRLCVPSTHVPHQPMLFREQSCVIAEADPDNPSLLVPMNH